MFIVHPHTRNIAIAAINSAMVVIVTTTLPSDELVCPFISLESEATSTIPMSRKGANTPLMTAV